MSILVIIKIRSIKFPEINVGISQKNYFTSWRESALKKSQKHTSVHTMSDLIVLVLKARK